jgi:hypothetical protein
MQIKQETTMKAKAKKIVVFQLQSENLTHLGGPMGSEYTTTNFTKPFGSLADAKTYAEKDYVKQAGKGAREIVWVRENPKYVRTEDMSFVMYHIRRTTVA